MTRLPGIGVEMAAAVRHVNAVFTAIPEDERPDVAAWGQFEREVDAACVAGDRPRALAAIADWRDETIAALRNGDGVA